MGQSISVTCCNCSYRSTFQLGIGMAYGDLERVLEWGALQDESLTDEVLGILRNHSFSYSDYGHVICRCPECNQLYEKFWIKLEYDNGKVYETTFNCGKCETRLEVIREEDLSRFPCPQCGKASLRSNRLMFWD